jgi:hypothetical protein
MSQFTSENDYRSFALTVKFKYRYVRTPKEEAFLRAVRFTAKERVIPLSAEWKFWRAQRGYCEGEIEQSYDEDKTVTIQAAKPYPPERMKPRSNQASEGRVNPRGIPCLYGATSPHIAVAEVRPWKGELVSVGTFSLCRDVKLIECLKYHDEDKDYVFMNTLYVPTHRPDTDGVTYTPQQPADEDISKNVWTHIDQAFSEPVTRDDDYADYAPTQISAEVFKEEGYDGICYRSKLSSDRGCNIAFFEPEVAKIANIYLFEVVDVKVEAKRHESRGIDFYSGKPILT